MKTFFSLLDQNEVFVTVPFKKICAIVFKQITETKTVEVIISTYSDRYNFSLAEDAWVAFYAKYIEWVKAQ